VIQADEGWEERMSQRAKARERAAREASREHQREKYMGRNPDLPWLNGWPRTSLTTVSMGHSYCIGCGRCVGMVCLVIEEGVEYPPAPDWPFTQDACPVCFSDAPFTWVPGEYHLGGGAIMYLGEGEGPG
jgi:ferredoxin